MLRKNAVLFTCFVTTCLLVCADDVGFTKALKSCSTYSESGTVNTSGIMARTTKKVEGWQGDRCVYKENISFMNIDSQIVCKLPKTAVTELASVMEAYDFLQKYSGQTSDLSDLDAAQNNPVSKAWNKYLQDSAVCTITTNQN